jgi:glycosyltransferase involved in cell wall biosynthesis
MPADKKEKIGNYDAPHYQFTFTVFIPTYNRAHTLGRAIESLEKQSFADFELVIIDDGSEDNTEELLQHWKQRVSFPINYHWQKNQGKHVAHNKAVELAKGYFLVTLDSDDMLHPNGLERLKKYWDMLPAAQKKQYAGGEGLCAKQNGEIYGSCFPEDIMDSNFLEITRIVKGWGEKKNAIRTDVLRQFLYPRFEGERHVRISLLWVRISRHYKFRYINEVIQIIEYQPGGLSADRFALRMRNPQGFRYYFLERIKTPSVFTGKYQLFKHYTKFIRYSLHCNVGFRQQYLEASSKFLWFMGLPRGVIGWLKDRIKLILKSL